MFFHQKTISHIILYVMAEKTDGNKYLLLDKNDNTLTALQDLFSGDRLNVAGMKDPLTVTEKIPYAHKLARVKITDGELVIKYGAVIGIATSDIEPGMHVHIHNVKGLRA